MKKPPQRIVIELLSDATFGRGEGTPGLVDVEVEHDDFGLPMLGGKALRGLLRDSWLSMQDYFPELAEAGRRVLGPHAEVGETAILRIGDVTIDGPSRAFFRAAVDRNLYPLSREAILAAFTDIRSQTSEERTSGAPAKGTLRSVRVVLRGLQLEAPLVWLDQPTPQDVKCLALACLATRHAGLGRNRGRGHIRLSLDGDVVGTQDLTEDNGR